jgi:hypothetical protein
VRQRSMKVLISAMFGPRAEETHAQLVAESWVLHNAPL